jgi:hypothetical protein
MSNLRHGGRLATGPVVMRVSEALGLSEGEHLRLSVAAARDAGYWVEARGGTDDGERSGTIAA